MKRDHDSGIENKKLFFVCIIALVATAFGFIIRAMVIEDWGNDFGLSKTQQGEIFGVGLWPFAISIILFSLIIDKIGYGKALVFAFICHIVSAVITIFADGYWMLYWGTFIAALGNGTIEAAINPMVATLYKEDKTKWLTILHGGWPGGMVLGGLIILAMGPEVSWQVKVGLIFIPTIAYGILMLGRKFPVQERVQAGVSYLDMLKEVGAIGALIVSSLIVIQVGQIFGWHIGLEITLIAIVTGVYGYITKSIGQPLFIFMLLIMIPLAITELGTDSWITDLMAPEMNKMGLQAGWVLVYTSIIMTLLRLFAGKITHGIAPLKLLMVCSLVAVVGLLFLSKATGIMVLLAATIYGIGKTFFWPTMLGVVAEKFPNGGALTLNVISGVGMLGVGILGAVVLGFVQDNETSKNVLLYDQQQQTSLSKDYFTESRKSIFGEYMAANELLLVDAPKEEKTIIENIKAMAKKNALKTVAIFPVFMFLCFLALHFAFKRSDKRIE